jgi:hypothetical protein
MIKDKIIENIFLIPEQYDAFISFYAPDLVTAKKRLAQTTKELENIFKGIFSFCIFSGP